MEAGPRDQKDENLQSVAVVYVMKGGGGRGERAKNSDNSSLGTGNFWLWCLHVGVLFVVWCCGVLFVVGLLCAFLLCLMST